MKTKNLFTCLGVASREAWILPALIAGLALLPAGRVTAQTFTTLHSFTDVPAPYYTNSDGYGPYAGVILSGNTLYGTAYHGGSSGLGTVFAVNTDGTGFTILHNFAGGNDGRLPYGGVILSGNTLYGTAYGGGSFGFTGGTVFKVNTDGTGFTTLHSFTGSDGVILQAGLIFSGNTLYGTANFAGSSGQGTVFAVNTDGTGFTTPHSFAGGVNDGARPYAGVILSGNTLYGTTLYGGSSGAGTVFAVNTNGTGFTILHDFGGGSDGANPYAGLVLSGNTLYGTASYGGSSGGGTLFKVSTAGTGFTILHSFISFTDGSSPDAGLMLSGNTLYGTTYSGGSSDRGTVFAVNTNGTGFTNLHNFTGGSDGGSPEGVLILSDNTLYGTAYHGGSSGGGTVFSLSLPLPSPPQLTIILSGGNVILAWPTNAAGFTLQSSTNLVSPAVWSTVSPGPIVIGGQNVVFNPVSGTQKFYRLSK